MAQLISILENKMIHDASSLHGLTPNVSTYTLQIGDPSSVFTTTSEVGMPSDVMLKSVDAANYSLVGHVHDVTFSGVTDEGGR